MPHAAADALMSIFDLHPVGSRAAAELERDAGNAAFPAGQVQVRAGVRFLVCVTSVRKRLLDEDNLAEKYHVDLLRYAGVISGDEAGTTQIATGQRKARKGEEEHTEITVHEIAP